MKDVRDVSTDLNAASVPFRRVPSSIESPQTLSRSTNRKGWETRNEDRLKDRSRDGPVGCNRFTIYRKYVKHASEVYNEITGMHRAHEARR